ncbi:MAG TPA: hypothetical protein VIP10_10755, partial [Burkholderiaceae bacterium]
MHARRVAVGRRAGGHDPCSNLVEVGGNHRHNRPKRIKTSPRVFVDITQLLAFSVKNKASDLHL